MGLLNTIKGALGLQSPIVAKEAEPLSLTAAGEARLKSLPPGHGIHVGTEAAQRGRLVTVEEGELQGPPAPGFEQVTIGDRDLERLRGLALDHDGTGWRVSTHLEIRARETPNPNSRLYITNRFLADGSPRFFTKESTDVPDLAAWFLEIYGVKTVLFRKNTITIERLKDVPWDRIDQGVNNALRTHFLFAGHRLESIEIKHSDGIEGRVQAVLNEKVLPMIHSDGGDIDLVSINNGVVKVKMKGACSGCPASTATLKLGVQRALVEAFPEEIHTVEQI